MILARRSFLVGLGSMLAAPAIVHAANIMPVRRVSIIIPERHVLYDHPAYLDGRERSYGLGKPRIERHQDQVWDQKPRLNRGKWVGSPPSAAEIEAAQAQFSNWMQLRGGTG